MTNDRDQYEINRRFEENLRKKEMQQAYSHDIKVAIGLFVVLTAALIGVRLCTYM